jgi:hypothetical protein
VKLKYFILLGIILTAVLYLYQDETLQKKLLGKVHQVAPELNKSTLYKWQNNKGEWQITDKPPAKGVQYITITSQDQVNVMPGLPAKKKK